MIGAWLVAPAILIALAAGCGLLLERVARVRLPGALVVPAGAAAVIAVGQLTTSLDATAELTTPLVVALAIAGFALLPGRSDSLRPDPWLAGAFLVVVFAYGAPVIVSGEPTFLGYIRLDDTATWLALTDRVMEHGHSLGGLAPSTYEATLAVNLGDGYPVGIFVPLGIAAALTGIDPAWLIQPYITLLAATLVPVLWELMRPVVSSRPARAAAVAVAAQPALLVGYAQWGGIKEVAAASLVALCVALAMRLARTDAAIGWVVPLAVSVSALLAVLSLAGAVWVVPVLIAAAFLLYRRAGRAEVLRRIAPLAGGIALLSLPLLVPALTDGRLLPPTSSSLASDTARGNLIGPLGLDRLAGIWPAGDFRLGAVDDAVATVLVALVCVLAVVGFLSALRPGGLALFLYGAGTLAGFAVLYAIGSPWVDGKALATASPVMLALAMVGGFTLIRRGMRLEGALLLVVIAAGVVWSNALAYRDANLAPYEQLRELERIGEEVAGEGPALMTEYQPYGVRHFLRMADAEGPSELRRRRIPLRNGDTLEKGLWADTDDLDMEALRVYRTLVLRRSPAQSRPPGEYRLVSSGEYYEVWQRPAGPADRSGKHLPLGSGASPVAKAPCTEVKRLTRDARELRYATGQAPVGLRAVDVDAPEAWTGAGETLIPSADGMASASIELPSAGTWRLWIGGSVRGKLTARIDGREVGATRHELQNAGLYFELGEIALATGSHALELGYEGPGIAHPGSGGRFPNGIGPLVLTPDTGAGAIETIPSERAHKLCGETLDWIEAVRTESSERTR